VTIPFLKITGWLLARAPEPLLHFTSWLLGPVVLFLPERRRLVYSNLHHAFPDRPLAWRRRIALKSSRRLIETSLLSLASPFMTDARLRSLGRLSPELTDALARRAALGEKAPPVLVATTHIAYWECLPWLALFTDYRTEVGVVFRPLRNTKLNDWIKATRERHGMKLYSRREGLMDVFRTMRRRGVVSILFDQNAGGHGSLATLLGRVCSTTEFPGMLVERYKARLVVIYPRRVGFWRIVYELHTIGDGLSSVETMVALNRWLENALANDDNLCASWLWSHGRWHAKYWPQRRFAYWLDKNLVDEDLARRGLTRATMPRKTHFWIRMPDDPALVPDALPLLRDLRRSRPDIALTLLAPERARPALQPLLDDATADHFIALPPSRGAARALLKTLRETYPDTILNLCETPQSDRQLKCARPLELFGLLRPNRRRPLLTHRYEVPAEYLATTPSQAALWRKLFEHFGLPPESDRSD
jgi:lauroyl/myristoyl acyltransferase